MNNLQKLYFVRILGIRNIIETAWVQVTNATLNRPQLLLLTFDTSFQSHHSYKKFENRPVWPTTLNTATDCNMHSTLYLLEVSISYISKKEKHDHFWNLCQEDLNDSN